MELDENRATAINHIAQALVKLSEANGHLALASMYWPINIDAATGDIAEMTVELQKKLNTLGNLGRG